MLSSRHPLAEFCNSEPRHREQRKAKRNNWGVELGSSRVKERRGNALSHDLRSSSWPPVEVNDMEPGSSFQGGETATEAHDKQCRRQSSRWDVRSEGIAHTEAILEGAACELRTCPMEEVHHIGTSQEGQVGAEMEGLVVDEHSKEMCLKNVKVVNDDGYVNSESELTIHTIQHQKTRVRDRHYRNEQSSVISGVTCIDSSRDGNTKSVSHSVNQETTTASLTSGNDGSCGLSSSSNYKLETSSLSEKAERASLILATESRRGDHFSYSSIESRLQSWEYFGDYGERTARSLLHYNRRSKKEKKSRQSENESPHSVSRPGCRVLDSGDGLKHDVGVTPSDGRVSRDEFVVHRDPHGSASHHKRKESPGENRPSSRQEEYSDRASRDESVHCHAERDSYGSGTHHKRNESPHDTRPTASSRQEEFGDRVSRDESLHCRGERDSYGSGGQHKRKESSLENRPSSRLEEYGDRVSRDESVHGRLKRDGGGHHRRKESPHDNRPSSRQAESGDRASRDELVHCQVERDSHGSGTQYRRKGSPRENRPSSRQEEFGDRLSKDELVHCHGERDSYPKRKESPLENRSSSRQEGFDDHVSRDESVHCQAEKDSYGSRHKRKESLRENRPSSRQEEFCDRRTTDSDECTLKSSLSEKSGPGSHGKDNCSGTGDNAVGNGFDESERSHLVEVDDKHHIEQKSLDDEDRKVDSEDCSGQSAVVREDDAWLAEMDVPMDISPAPAEDNASSSQFTCIETIDPVSNEHIVTAPQIFYEDPDGRGWIYLDSEGITQGPMSLSVLKSFMGDGRLQPDHMIQLDGSNAWLTLEHAGLTPDGLGEAFLPQLSLSPKAESNAQPCLPPMPVENIFDQKSALLSSSCELPEDLDIDNRVNQFMQGLTLVSGKEKEIISEALHNASRHMHSETEAGLEDEESLHSHGDLANHWRSNQMSCDEYFVQGHTSNEITVSASVDSSVDAIAPQSTFQSSRMWTSRGGDWKLMYQMENTMIAKGLVSSGRPEKLVLNKAKPLCEKTYHRLPDPRRGSALYEAPISQTLELPPWAYRYWDAMGEYYNTAFENLNAICTPRSQVSTPKDVSSLESLKKLKFNNVNFVSDQKLEESLAVNSSVATSTLGHLQLASVGTCDRDEGPSLGQDFECSNLQLERQAVELAVVNKVTEECTKPVRQVPKKDDLKLETGDWFYHDGNGQEIGPYTFLQLQSKVRDGLLYEGSSVYRKSDETWVPLLSTTSIVEDVEGETNQKQEAVSAFHQLYPQFIGFMCGRLHEHVMKSYKSRDFAAMVDEGSRSCFGSKKAKTSDGLELEQDRSDLKQRESSFVDRIPPSLSSSSGYGMDQKDSRVGRMKSLLELDDGRMHSMALGAEGSSWSLIDPRLLMRVFRYLETDVRSLVLASITCKSWRAALMQFKKEITQIDFSSLGSLCSDDIFCSFTEHAQNVSHVILRGCTTLSPAVVKTFLQGLHSIESVDAKGCDQLRELMHSFPQVSFSRSQPGGLDSHHKSKGVKSQGDKKGSSMGKHSLFLDEWKGRKLSFTNAHIDGVTEPMDCDTPNFLQQNADASHGVTSNDFKRIKLQGSGKPMKMVADNYFSKVGSRDGFHARDKEQFDFKHKQNSSFSSTGGETNALTSHKGDSSPAVGDRKLEKEMANVLQCLKDLKTPSSMKVSSLRCREVELSRVEDKLRRGSYTANMQGLRTFKSDLLDVARMLFRLKELDAGNAIFTNTFRLTNLLLHELKGKDMPHSKPFKRKYEDLNSNSSLSGRKRGIGNALREQVIGKRRKGHDESSDEDECEYNFASKSEASGTDEEDDYLSQDDKDEDSAQSDSEVESESEGEGKLDGEKELLSEDETDSRIWGARMTKASMVPPATRKYELIEEYVIVADVHEVKKRMGVNLPKDYDKMVQAQEDRGIEYSHLEMPELREFKMRKNVQGEVVEQEVYGIDPYTHNLLIDSMPASRSDFSDARRHQLIEEDILKALNQEVRQFTGTGKAPTKYPLESVVNRALEECRDLSKRSFISVLAKNMRSRKESHMKDTYVAYRKGLGVVCNHATGFEKDEFVVEFFGEVYPAWRWFEKQDAIRSFQKKDKDSAPEFYNIFLERPKGDASGYDLVVVDAMHKANYASRICHSCRPNCEARVTAVNGRYQIGVYTLRPVEYGEELTFDYNSITESKEEHEKSVCLCGSHVCRGSYLNFAGPETFQEIMKEDHSLLHRHDLLLHACIDGYATAKDWDVLKQAGLGSCLLDGLPGWTIKYAAGVVRFVNEERKFLPREILKSILSERRLERAGESEALDAEIQADGVFNTRLQNLAITLDKVRYVFKKVYGDPEAAPPPLRMLKPSEVVSLVWKHENSVVADLLHGMSQHISKEDLLEFKRKVREHEPSQSGDISKNLQQSLIWLRDELCKAPIACVSRHDGAADLIHMYAYTKLFFTCQDYPTFDSPPLTISPLDLGPKHAHKLGTASSKEWSKFYSKDYVLGQLIFWYKPNVAEPGASLAKASRGCLCLPNPTSCYAKSSQQRLIYGSMDRLRMFRRMEHKPSRPWSWKGQLFWEFRNNRQLLGSPMMDSIHQGTCVNKEMMDWLKRRTRTFESSRDC